MLLDVAAVVDGDTGASAALLVLGASAALVPALGYPGILAAQALSPVLPCVVGVAYLGRYARRVKSEMGTGAKAAS